MKSRHIEAGIIAPSLAPFGISCSRKTKTAIFVSCRRDRRMSSKRKVRKRGGGGASIRSCFMAVQTVSLSLSLSLSIVQVCYCSYLVWRLSFVVRRPTVNVGRRRRRRSVGRYVRLKTGRRTDGRSTYSFLCLLLLPSATNST
jgi:hypothetical protein